MYTTEPAGAGVTTVAAGAGCTTRSFLTLHAPNEVTQTLRTMNGKTFMGRSLLKLFSDNGEEVVRLHGM